MKKNTKKKVFTLMLVIMLLSIAIVGGSLAWFTDEDEATNVFTVGSIMIEQEEDYVQNSQLLPVVKDDPSNEDDNYIKKSVTVKNTGNNGAYIQTLVAVPACLDNEGVLKLYDANCTENGWIKLDRDTSEVGIQPSFLNVSIPAEGNLRYNVYVYRYQSILESGEETAPCLEYVYIDEATDMETSDTNGDKIIDTGYFVMNGKTITEFNAFDDLNIYVLTQAVQADGFGTIDEAMLNAFNNKCPTFGA